MYIRLISLTNTQTHQQTRIKILITTI